MEYLNKYVKTILKMDGNTFFFRGKCIEETDESLTIQDLKTGEVTIVKRADITSITIKEEDYEWK